MSRTTASTSGGMYTSAGLRSTATLSGASSVTARRTTGGFSYSLIRSLALPATSARSSGRVLVSTRAVSNDASSLTGTTSSDGSSALTTSHSTTAKNSAAALYASRSVSAAISHRCSDAVAAERSPSGLGIAQGRVGACAAPGAPVPTGTEEALGASSPTPRADSGTPSSSPNSARFAGESQL